MINAIVDHLNGMNRLLKLQNCAALNSNYHQMFVCR